MATFADAVEAYGRNVKKKLSGPGEREALISGPISELIEQAGDALGVQVSTHDQIREQDGSVRPDFGISVNNVLSGHVEVKAPGVSLDPSSYGKTTHNAKQWERLRRLPNLLHTNGLEWRLWRFGELVGKPVWFHATKLDDPPHPLLAAPAAESLFSDFLQWSPAPITSVARLVEVLAPLARLLREEVLVALQSEHRAAKQGADVAALPFSGIARDWRSMLFPRAKDAEFADGFAQTVVFAVVLAISDGEDIKGRRLSWIARRLQSKHGLMGRALDLLTEHIDKTPVALAIDTITRTLSAVQWNSVAAGRSDVYLHLYEHFLDVYDSEMRRATGSYYTPVEIVDEMVRLTDDALKLYLGKDRGLRSAAVSIVDPAMGTGTYPLSVLRHVGQEAAEEYGLAARGEAISSAVERTYGIEIQSGPFSVAELRISQLMNDEGASFPQNGLNLFVADTLEDPESGSDSQLSYSLQLIARQRQLANRMKREENIQVCIGNPPYKERAAGLGGWIEKGSENSSTPMDGFKYPGNGSHEFNLKNLYVYFWRWATWKVFESTDRPTVTDGGSGVITFITATGYLTGPGFKGMRNYLRRHCSHGWIINVTPEGKRPPSNRAIFNIETPVAIGMFLRDTTTSPDDPATIKYRAITGTRKEKYAKLAQVTLDDDGWSLCRADWTAPFTPASGTLWDEFPALEDLLPWRSTGVTPNRRWVVSASRGELEMRFRELLAEDDPERQKELLKTTRDRTIEKKVTPLPGADTEQLTHVSLKDQQLLTDLKTVRIGWRPFDNQYVIADSRLLDMPRPPLWSARSVPNQVFLVEQHSIHPGVGAAVAFTAFMPDINYFNNRGGRVMPRLHPNGSLNCATNLDVALRDLVDGSADDLFAYIAGISGHQGFVEEFDNELSTPGVRIPITGDSKLWRRAVDLGRQIMWCYTLGQYGDRPDLRESPSYDTPMQGGLPTKFTYSESTHQLFLGGGVWSNVAPEVRLFKHGGKVVLDEWLDSRSAKPSWKITSPLDRHKPTVFEPQWAIELTEILRALTGLTSLASQQRDLLSSVLTAPTLSRSQLASHGVVWPVSKGDREVRYASSVEPTGRQLSIGE